MWELTPDMRRRWARLDERTEDFDAELVAATEVQDGPKRLLFLPDIGALDAAASVAAVDDAGILPLTPGRRGSAGLHIAAGHDEEPSKIARRHPAQDQGPAQATARDGDPGRAARLAVAEIG